MYCKECGKVCEHDHQNKVEGNGTYTYSKCSNCGAEKKVYGKAAFNHETQKWRK